MRRVKRAILVQTDMRDLEVHRFKTLMFNEPSARVSIRSVVLSTRIFVITLHFYSPVDARVLE